MSDLSRIMDKIKKCLALSASSNEHEAAAALRQAQKLMAEHGISAADVAAAQATEFFAKSQSKRTPSSWESRLASACAVGFGCQTIFLGGSYAWTFIGTGPAPEIAGYAYAVLQRQAIKARRGFIGTVLKRCGPATKTRRADAFCLGWVGTATSKLQALEFSEHREAAIDAFRGKYYPATRSATPRNGAKPRDVNDFARGMLAGRDAELNRGVGGQDLARLEAQS